ncbi:hypothetical protein AMTRI_Chr04g248210 [Amborella trichopoda]
MIIINVCVICKEDEETIHPIPQLQVFLQYGSGSIVWLAPGPIMPIFFFNRCGRNLRIFEGRFRDIMTLLSDIQSPNLLLFSCFKDLLFLKCRQLSLRHVWTKPPEGWFKLNFDRSVRGARSGYSGLLRNHNGSLI